MKATLELTDPVSEAPAPRSTAKRKPPRPLVLASPAILLAFLLFLPFLNKAFSIDDPMNLLASAHAMHDFLHPRNFDICWDSPVVCRPATQVISSSTLIAYFLLPASFFGSPERLVHMMQFGVLCLGIAATVSVALRLELSTLEASLSGMLVALFPPTLVYVNGATPDILAFALGAAGMDRLLLWKRARSVESGVAAGILLGLAPLARPHLLLLVPIAAVTLAFGTSGRLSRLVRALWPPAIAASLFAAGILLASVRGAGVTLVPQRLIVHNTAVFNAVSYFWYLIVPFPFGLAWIMGARRTGVAVLLTAAGIFLALTRLNAVNGWVALIVVCAGCGAFALVSAVYQAIRERSGALLFLTAWSAIPLAAMSYTHLPPKYLIGCAPAIAIMIVLALRKSRFPLTCVCALLGGCLILSWLTLRADEEFAGKARLAAEDLIRPETAAGQTVWFTGEWGIYWYAQRAGARVLMPTGPQPMAGDLLLIAAEGADAKWQERFPHRTLVARREYVSRFGRTMNHAAGAGLHSNVMGPFVWSPGNGYLDAYDLWRIEGF